MNTLGWLVVALAVGGAACSRTEAPADAAATNASTAGDNPLTAPADYLGAAAKAQRAAVKTIDLTSVNQAIQLFNASEGRFPKDLKELVTEQYLPRIPELPTGMKFLYDSNRGEVKVVAD